jgi:hypothetical protein
MIDALRVLARDRDGAAVGSSEEVNLKKIGVVDRFFFVFGDAPERVGC